MYTFKLFTQAVLHQTCPQNGHGFEISALKMAVPATYFNGNS